MFYILLFYCLAKAMQNNGNIVSKDKCNHQESNSATLLELNQQIISSNIDWIKILKSYDIDSGINDQNTCDIETILKEYASNKDIESSIDSYVRCKQNTNLINYAFKYVNSNYTVYKTIEELNLALYVLYKKMNLDEKNKGCTMFLFKKKPLLLFQMPISGIGQRQLLTTMYEAIEDIESGNYISGEKKQETLKQYIIYYVIRCNIDIARNNKAWNKAINMILASLVVVVMAYVLYLYLEQKSLLIEYLASKFPCVELVDGNYNSTNIINICDKFLNLDKCNEHVSKIVVETLKENPCIAS